MEDIFKEKFYAIKLLNEPKLAQKLAIWCSALVVFTIACTFMPWTQNIRSSGSITVLEQEHRPQNVESMIAGRIEKWIVHEGDYVKAGDTILIISEVKDKYFDPETTERTKEQLTSKEQMLGANYEKIKALSSQISALTNNRAYSINKGKNKIEQTKLKVQSDSMDVIAAKLDFTTAKIQLERTENLYQQGLKSLTDVEQKKLKFQDTKSKLVGYENKWNSSKQELLNNIIEINSIEADYLDKISKAQSDKNSAESYGFNLEGEISKLKNEYRNLQIRNTFYAIKAPQEGTIVRAVRNGVGENIKEGEPVASIMPTHPHLAAELFVRPMDMPLITKGTKVRLQFDAWPALVFSGWPNTSFGTFGGIIEVIDQIDTQGKYRILVIQDPEDEKWPERIPVGSGVYGWAMLKDVPIWYEIWRELNGFPPDYVDHSVKSSAVQGFDTSTKKDTKK